MKNLLSKSGEKSLCAFLNRDTLLAFDLDGTLAAIQPDPNSIEVATAVQHELMLLMQYVPVAVITGRSCRDASQFLKVLPDYLVGNHGAEGLGVSEGRSDELKDIIAAWKTQMSPRIQSLGSGIVLEDKEYSLSIHYRHAANQRKACNTLLEAVAGLTPAPRVVGGKSVLNLVLPDTPDKGDALLTLLKQSGASRALFLGDDVTDEDVFALQDVALFKVRVGRSSTSKAEWFVNSQEDVLILLSTMVSCLNRSLTNG